jgi:cysteine desulfurase/selenocysteine lyase
LDSGATSQKPKAVLDALTSYYENNNANIHRGIHTLGDESTRMYQESREAVAGFIDAGDSSEVLFVRNTTEAINLVAYAWGRKNVKSGDVILLTEMEHHSNVVPWQVLVDEVGAKVEYVLVNEEGVLDMDDLNNKLLMKPKLLSLVHVSNFLGTINPIEEIVKLAKENEVKVLVDGAQAVPHMRVSMRSIGADFYAFSGHKMLAPMGIGVLYVKKENFSDMSPFLFGGGMISEVHKSDVIYASLPDKYDGGTPNVAGAVGIAEAIKYLEEIGMDEIEKHEKELMEYALEKLRTIEDLKIFGPKNIEDRGGVVSFTVEGAHAHDVAQILDREMGVAVRSGHHCTMIMHEKLGVPATTRASFYLYNNKEDVDKLVEGINKVKKIFGEPSTRINTVRGK